MTTLLQVIYTNCRHFTVLGQGGMLYKLQSNYGGKVACCIEVQ